MEEIGKIRRSQVISGNGPGAIVDFRGTDGAPISVVTAGLEKWDDFADRKGLENAQIVRHTRLEEKLGVEGFRLPPVGRERSGKGSRPRLLPSFRFPSWHVCPSCNLLQPAFKWSEETGRVGLFCTACSGHGRKRKIFVLPARFIVTCRNGHLDEFPWNRLVRHTKGCAKKSPLKLIGKGAGLKGLTVHCPECAQKWDLDGALTPSKFNGLKHSCKGRRPWLGAKHKETCDEKPVAIQRAASNAYFPVTLSALDVPPLDDMLKTNLDEHWSRLRSLSDLSQVEAYVRKYMDIRVWPDSEATVESLSARIRQRLELLQCEPDILTEEYFQFTSGSANHAPESKNFRISPQSVPEPFIGPIDHLVSAERLREVRVQRGFTRLMPWAGGETEIGIASLSETPQKWLPAIEVHGEGVFIALNEECVAEWERTAGVETRAAHAHKVYSKTWKELRKTNEKPPFRISPRRLLVHTLSHAVATRLSLESGYSTASIRERLYVSEEGPGMCGFLLFTSSPDSDGTLGGLSREGRTDRMGSTLEAAIRDLEWCSSDPLCSSGMLSVAEDSGLAACHSCAFVPETTCEHFNRHLDRAMLVGTPEKPELGYFSGLLSGVL